MTLCDLGWFRLTRYCHKIRVPRGRFRLVPGHSLFSWLGSMAKPKIKGKTNAAAAKPGNARGDQRRRTIFKALHDCILAKGYTRTTLNDIAADAGMTPSHLLYYFKGKEAILEQYFDEVAVRFLAQFERFEGLELAEHVIALADFWFLSPRSTRKEIGFMLECFGAAVNDDILRVTKADFDRQCKRHLADLFAKAPSLSAASETDAAETCYALMIGLRSAVYFDENIGLEDAHRLFLGHIRAMTGLAQTMSAASAA